MDVSFIIALLLFIFGNVEASLEILKSKQYKQ